MKNLEQLYEKLEEYNNFDNHDNCERFIDYINMIASYKNPDSIQFLLKYFNNDSPVYPMEALMIAVESYLPEQYIKTLLLNLSNLLPQREFWLQGLFYGILNNPLYYEELKKNIHLTSKESLLKLFSIMEQESPPHRELIVELRQELEKATT